METYSTCNDDSPPQSRGEIYDFGALEEKGCRRSTKAVRGQSTGDPRLFGDPSTKHQFVQAETNVRLRRRAQEWGEEVKKAYRASARLPEEPPATIGGFYKT